MNDTTIQPAGRRKAQAFEIAKLALLLVLLQLILTGGKQLFFQFFERTNTTDTLASAALMLLLAAFVLLLSYKTHTPLSALPRKFSLIYIVSTVTAVIIVLSCLFFVKFNMDSVLTLIYGSVILPLYEELLFRGFVWNRLRSIFKSDWTVYLIVCLLFALWHLGYIETVAFHAGENLGIIMLWKVLTGLGYGAVIGLARIKTKNCCIGFLLHAVANAIAP